MKTLSKILLIIIAAQLYACKKDNTNSPSNKQLTGKWQLIRTRIGNGGQGEWVNDVKTDIEQFNTDGTLTGSIFSDCKYVVKNSTVLTIITKANATGNNTYTTNNASYNYYYKTTTDSLTMSVQGATEGDTMQFARIK